MNVTVHALPLILLIIDFVLNRVPFVLRHIVIAIFVILIYGIMNMSITLITGHPLYPILDYKDYKTALYMLGMLVVLVLSFVGLFFLAKIKNAYYDRVSDRRNKEVYSFSTDYSTALN